MNITRDQRVELLRSNSWIKLSYRKFFVPLKTDKIEEVRKVMESWDKINEVRLTDHSIYTLFGIGE